MATEIVATELGLQLGDHVEIVLAEPSFSDFEAVGLDIVGISFLTEAMVVDERLPFAAFAASRAEIKVGPGAKVGAVVAALAGEGLFIDENVDDDRKVVQRAVRPRFTRHQVRDTVLWQSGAILAPALVVTVPVGIAAGRWLWTAFADTLGIVASPAVPVLLLGVGLLVTVVVAEVAAIVPATIARRSVLDRSLRAE